MTTPLTSEPAARSKSPSALFAWLALGVALFGLWGSVHLSLAMGLKACPLCYYQRTFVMAVFVVLGFGLWGRLASPGVICILALPLATAGAVIGGFHVAGEVRGAMECPAGLWGLGTAPQQAFAVQALMVVLLIVGFLRGRTVDDPGAFGLVAPLVVAVLLANVAMKTVSIPPPPPPEAYQNPPDGCRPLPPPAAKTS